LAGCEAPVASTTQPRPFENQKLTLRCPDAAFADAIMPMVHAWAARTGAEVDLRREAMTPTDDTDLAIIPSGQLGEWAEPALLAPVPVKYRANDNPFQWFGLLPAYGERLIEWGGQTVALPLTGDGVVVVYRADRLGDKKVIAEYTKRHHHAPAAPTTWEEFADLAAVFAAVDGKPSLPPLPANPERLFELFSRVASSADREALDDARLAARTAHDRDAIAFTFSVVTGKPRLQAAGFEEAAKWLAQLHAEKSLAPGSTDDPVAALAEGKAMLAVLTLDQLAKLPREGGVVPPRFALTGVPGTRIYYHADLKKIAPSATPNYVPHFAGGRLGVVRTRCQNMDAAFDLLADLGSPARSGELIATPGLGAGPTRVAHLDRERLILWFGYGFDEERSKALQDAMRRYVEQAVKNPTLGLRGPDRAALISAADSALRKIGTGTVPPAEGMKQAEAAWLALDAKVPPATLLRWRQRAAGLH
jgi:ABC-type glycerol-3-phosphate transport system substrate-binding protein